MAKRMTEFEKAVRITSLQARIKEAAKEYFKLVAPTAAELDIAKEQISCDDDWSDNLTDENDVVGQYFLADFVQSCREMYDNTDPLANAPGYREHVPASE